ncbi:MAG: sensor histidine kinase [Patescibacteria group bacterium]
MPKTAKNPELSAIIAHELRAPIGTIRAAAAMLAEGGYGKLPKEAKEIVRVIQSTSDKLLNQTEGYLQVLEINSGGLVINPTATNVAKLLKEIIRQWQPAAKAKKIKLELQIAKIPQLLKLDQVILNHVLFNLLDNAFKFTDKGRIMVAVSRRHNLLSLRITDTGMGIDKKQIKSLFINPAVNNFADNAGKRRGLGLFIVHQLLKAAKGAISVTSAGKNKGSTFSVQLPALKVD